MYSDHKILKEWAIHEDPKYLKIIKHDSKSMGQRRNIMKTGKDFISHGNKI